MNGLETTQVINNKSCKKYQSKRLIVFLSNLSLLFRLQGTLLFRLKISIYLLIIHKLLYLH